MYKEGVLDPQFHSFSLFSSCYRSVSWIFDPFSWIFDPLGAPGVQKLVELVGVGH